MDGFTNIAEKKKVQALEMLREETIARRNEMKERKVGDKIGEVMSFYMIKDRKTLKADKKK